MQRYLQRTVPVAPLRLSISGNSSTEGVHADAAPLLESRFLRRLRAEVDREARAEQLCKGTAARAIQQAFRRWAQTRQLQHRHLSIHGIVRPRCEFDPIRAAELDAALCSIQASLRVWASSRLVEARRLKLLQQITSSVLDPACRTTLRCAASIRHINDRQLREVLCRQEAVERRDLLRRHFVFLVCCHQAFFNDPRMWDAGMSIRRIPLYTHHGLLSAETLPVIWGTRTSSSTLNSATEDSVALRGDAVASPLPPESSSFSVTATVDGCIKGWGSPAEPGSSLLEAVGSDWLVGKEEDGGGFDIDAALRLGEYRLLFSPEEWRLLKKLKASSPHPASPLLSSGADGRRAARDAAGLPEAEAGALAAPRGQLQMAPTEAAAKSACSLSYAKAFASALTFLRQPRMVDPSVRCTVQRLNDIRSSTLEMQQELRVHGYLFAAQVAPLLILGFHYQGLARGDADLSCFTTTSAMKTCRPLVAGRVACAATELRRCLIGAVHYSGGAAESVLPVALEEHKCSGKAAARTLSQRLPPAGVSRSMLLPPRAAPTAGLMRDGFANPGTEALYHAPAKTTRRAGGADPRCGSSHTASRHGSAIRVALAAEWSRRLASSADEVGPYWCEFLSSTGLDGLVTAAGRRGETPGEADAAYQTRASLPSPPLPTRVRRGLESHLVHGGSSYLLQDFMPSLMRRRAHSRAGPQPLDAATGSVVVAVACAGASPSTSVSTSTCGMVHAGEWWDAVERLLLREYTNRRELLTNEAVQRSSIDILRCTAHPSADESVAGV
ncbi:conserved hypothetical protein [Leishmania major strain Friedlin]|uniref:Uncharacterized protein n=1 Tax=Leishmania major TaxID=5664 RepID=Q4Q1Q6_LEIMA|nr:conserved hypothetical protein [Leishmania major strain Friedlin]CAG9583690.1 hypothetical_protein_-_conserved [Leishmania major strain Friedlin]CAJ09123.1 conserved hypothetical protein [Leishmania major strain Friedlin]|eukprot:XP_001686742.1 conserved hypothetical protein [Leishmania major strain Friedlin]